MRRSRRAHAGREPSAFGDPLYTEPYLDIDEWRDQPVRHRYVHGGFVGTEARFSIYFPSKEQYEGRFFQPLMAVSGNENTAAMAMGRGSEDTGSVCAVLEEMARTPRSRRSRRN